MKSTTRAKDVARSASDSGSGSNTRRLYIERDPCSPLTWARKPSAQRGSSSRKRPRPSPSSPNDRLAVAGGTSKGNILSHRYGTRSATGVLQREATTTAALLAPRGKCVTPRAAATADEVPKTRPSKIGSGRSSKNNTSEMQACPYPLDNTAFRTAHHSSITARGQTTLARTALDLLDRGERISVGEGAAACNNVVSSSSKVFPPGSITSEDQDAGCTRLSIPPEPSASVLSDRSQLSGSSWIGGRCRVRSRLSLKKHCAAPAPAKKSDTGPSNDILHVRPAGSAACGHPSRTSLVRDPRRPSLNCAVPLTVDQYADAERSATPDDRAAAAALLEGKADDHHFIIGKKSTLTSAPQHSTPPILASCPQPQPRPPFVGLKNLGDTCYINVVVQALRACSAVMAPVGVVSFDRGCDGGAMTEKESRSSGRTLRSDERAAIAGQASRTSSTCALESKSTSGSVAIQSSEGSRSEGGHQMIDTLGTLLMEMNVRNRELLGLYPGCDGAQGPNAVAPPAVLCDASLNHPRSSKNARAAASVLGGSQPVSQQTSPPYAPEYDATVITPSALVELIRYGWRGNGCTSEPIKENDVAQHKRATAARSSFGGFGSGHQCASEFLGKVLDTDICPRVAGRTSGDSTAGSVTEQRDMTDTFSACNFSRAFRGVLCAQTLCVECEKGRASHENFAEIALPPLSARPSGRASHGAFTGEGISAPEQHRTLQGLVETLLDKESLEGQNKVWCEGCRQWTEAVRQSSLHIVPELLALHVRPATGAPIVAPTTRTATPVETSLFKSNERDAKPKKESDDGSSSQALIERTLRIRGDDRCCSRTGNTCSGATGPSREALLETRSRSVCGDDSVRRSDDQTRLEHTERVEGAHLDCIGSRQRQEKGLEPDDANYDLVGIILHKGQTLGSGHYTFVLDTGRHLHSSLPHPSSIAEKSPLAPTSSGVTGSTLDEPAPGTESSRIPVMDVNRIKGRADVTFADSRLVLFDDECVRWLSSTEESVVMGGGGNTGGLGDAFLVFYARSR